MGGIVGGITDAIGLTDHKGARRAERASAEAAAQSLAMTKDQLAFQKEQYEDWKDIYGTMQEKEAAYVAEYTGEDVVTKQLAQTDKEFQTASADVTKTLAQRGIAGSGMEAAALTQLAGQEALTKAGIRASQEDIAAQKRTQFLGLGLGQGTQMLGIQAGVAQSGIGAQASIAGQQSALSGKLGAAGIQSWGKVVGGIGGGLARS